MAMTNNTYPPSASTLQGREALDSPVSPMQPLPGREPAPELLTRVVKGAHDTIDRLADQAAPQLQRLGEGMSGANDALHVQAERLRATGDEWAQSLRGTVRDNPLAAVAGAVALGVLIARLTR